MKDKIIFIFKTIKKYGISYIFRKPFEILYFKIKKVDFSDEIVKKEHKTGKDKKYSSYSHHTSSNFLTFILNELQVLEPDITKGIFVDYGCGKGITLVTAKKFGFRKVIGIESVVAIYQICLNNISLLINNDKNNIIVLNKNVINFIPTNDISVIFFYNPFDDATMNICVKNMLKVKYDKTLYIIYVNPKDRLIFENHNCITILTNDMYDIYKYKKI